MSAPYLTADTIRDWPRVQARYSMHFTLGQLDEIAAAHRICVAGGSAAVLAARLNARYARLTWGDAEARGARGRE